MLKLILLFPFLGFLINGLLYLFGQASPRASGKSSITTGYQTAGFTGTIATVAIFSSFVVSVLTFLHVTGGQVLQEVVFNWFRVGNFSLDFGLRVDELSSLFLLVITGVGTLIHLYSIGYMSHDETPGKFFAYLNLFCFAMLTLVMGASLPVLFLGWEGVGLCSYLLIGYWYTDTDKAIAGKKAFIVNRVGDLGFLLGMFVLFWTFGALDFVGLKESVLSSEGFVDPTVYTIVGILLFVGCAGKSAQIPLYVWLPDAMAGPTPVSALIHAATMVTSGVYLISRMNFLYTLSPTAMQVVAVTGALTAFFAATIAIVQTDIKKVLAYSTVSQLGYMFLGCGVGAFGAGVFHVITHAFFKALLFLGAGSVIHGMHEEQNILKMGGLRSKMPKTFLTFALGWLAISGIPPFSGFFSKDEILWLSFHSKHGSVWLWFIGAMTAVMTAFYMTRLFSLTFLGSSRVEKDKHPHESPWMMTLPLQVLAFLSVVGGFIGIPHMSWLEHWLAPVLGAHESAGSGAMEWILMALSVIGAVLGVLAGLRLYERLPLVNQLKQRFSFWHHLLDNKWFIDEIYEAVLIRPIQFLSHQAWKIVDVNIIDRFVLSFGRVSERSGEVLRVIQTGSLQAYAFAFLLGVIAIAGFLVYGLA